MKTAIAISAAAAIVGSVCTSAGAAEQPAYPVKSIRILVGAPPGGSNDIFARAIAQSLNTAWGQPALVDNRPGANQMLAADIMAKSPPDGHTMYVTSSSFTTGVAMQPKQPFDPINDVAGVTLLASGPMVVVIHPSLPARTVKDLVALAKAKPGVLNYVSAGVGSINHMSMELFRAAAHIDVVHVPHKGMSPAITDLMAGNVQVLIVSLPSVSAQMSSGRLRAIAVTSPKRSSFVPDMPTVSESGVPGYEASLWWGLFAPGKTPKPVLTKINEEVRRAMGTPEMSKRFADFGAEAAPTSPEGLSALVQKEIERWSKVVRDANIKAE